MEHGKYVGVRKESRRDGVCTLRKRTPYMCPYGGSLVHERREKSWRATALSVSKGVGIFLVDILGLEARHAIRERHTRSHAVGGATEAIHVLACVGRYSVC